MAQHPATLTQLFVNAVEEHDQPNALQTKVGDAYQPISHRTLADRVRHVAFGLKALGIPAGNRVAILSENRPEWAIADYACLMSGMTDVPIYPTLPAEQVAYILRDSGAVAIFISSKEQAAKVALVRDQLPALQHVIVFDADAATGAAIRIAALEAKGAATMTPDAAAEYRAYALAIEPDQVATLIYTSGTTGEPKGAMLTHGNIASNVSAALQLLPMDTTDTSLSFLPLSHIFERMVDYLMFAGGVSIAYVETMDTIAQNMKEVRPTIVVSVPRIYEKIHSRITDTAMQAGGAKRAIFLWAQAVGERWTDVMLVGKKPGMLLGFEHAIADKLVFSKVRAAVGGRLRYFVSGGAPLSPEINRFFYAAGLKICEGYGLTETSPVIAVNSPKRFTIGTVGEPMPGVEVKIAPDGEILTRGPHVMKGYFNKPEATAEAIDADGWFHTGDIGTLEDGLLRITDRKKDIIVTANGKNIAPQPIENSVRANKYVVQAVMIGDRRKFPLVLVVPNFDQLTRWANYKNIAFKDHHDLLANPLVQAKMEREVIGELGKFASFEKPKKVVLLEQDFTIENGELTPTLKVKRRTVDRKFRALIDAAYTAEESRGGA
ncbi:MAG: long-chain fatty acid--CoA ligase [Gemmatimonadaceae bacterium]|nr:long-chain fatty acid--CoA ligase [Gemmatimonadaceae bacterium]